MSTTTFPSTGKPKFNPNAAFEAVEETPVPKGKKPAFNPKAAFEPVEEKPIEQPQPVQPKAFEVKLSEPTYQSAPAQTGERTFTDYKAPDVMTIQGKEIPLEVQKLGGEARIAHENLHKELNANDAQYEKKLREYRRDSYTVEKLRSDYKKNGWHLSPSDEQSILQKEKQKQYNLPVTPEDISDIKTGTILNDVGARKFVKDLNNTELNHNIYKIDKYNEVSNDPNGNYRVAKIKKNAENIKKGKYIYDPVTKQLIKPVGLLGAAVEGTMNKLKLDDKYDFYKNAPDHAIVNQLEDERNNPDTDEPIVVPKSKIGEFIKSGAEMPLTPILAGTVGSLAGTFIGAPEAGMYAGAAVGAYENRKAQFATTFPQIYNELRDKGINPNEAVIQARGQAENAQEIGTIVGGAQGLIGGQIAKVPFSKAYTQSVGNVLKQNSSELGNIFLEGAGQGAIGAIGEAAKNKLAQSIGINRPISDNVWESFISNTAMAVGIGAAIKAGKGLSKIDYRNILHGISKQPQETINAALNEKVQNGEITQKAADETLQRINDYKELDMLIPDNVNEEARFKIQDKILKRNELNDKLETIDKAYHPEIKEKIKAIDEEIINLTKENKEKPQKPESGLSREQEKDATEFAEELVHEGILPDTYSEAVKKDPIGFWKTIAQQAQNRDENWNPLSEPIDEAAVREQYGDTVVDYAKELFPAPEMPKSELPKPISEHNNSLNDLNERAKKLGYKGIKQLNTQEQLNENASPEVKKLLQDYGEHNGRVKSLTNENDISNLDEDNFGTWVKANDVQRDSLGRVSNGNDLPLASKRIRILNERGMAEEANAETERLKSSRKKDNWAKDEWNKRYDDELSQEEVNNINKENSEFNRQLDKELNNLEPKKSKISVIQPGEIKHPETITIKPQSDAVRQRISKEIHVGQTSGNSPEMGARIPESGEATNAQGIGTENKGTGQEEIGPLRVVGITHRQMDAIAEEFGLPTYEKSPEKVKEWDERAINRLNDPNAIPDLFEKLRNGQAPDAEETRMMLFYMSDLMAKIDKNPSPELITQLKRTKDLFNVAGRIQGQQLAARKGTIGSEERLGDFLIRDMDANKAPLTDEQTKQATEEFNEIKKAKDEYEAKVAKLESENAKLKAEKEIQKVSKENKSQKKDYKSERKDIIADIREKLRKARGETSVVAVPYAKELIAIAPDVMKLVRNLVEEGIEKLPDIIKAVHGQLKDILPDITENDVHNIIAGEYNEKKTKSEISEKIYNLKNEAKLINRLEALEAGIEPKDERAKVKRNREIEELKQKINEHDLTKLSTYKKRVQSDINKLEEQLRKGEYKEIKKPEIKLDKEAIELKDKLIQLRQEREKRLAQIEYENRTNIEKAKDVATNILNVPRTLMASADLSAPLRQGIVATVSHPSLAAKAFPEMLKQAFSQKQFDRWLFDLKESPDYPLMDKSRLYIADPNNLHLAVQEEQFMTNLGEKIPIVGRLVKGSERAYVAYLNKMRVDLFREGVRNFEDAGKTFENSPDLYKGLADYINTATGRGKLGNLEQAAQVLNTAFFSPRLIASRINLLNPLYYTKLPKEVRIMALKDMAKLVGFGASILGLASIAGADVEKDPRSSDFGKIKVGNTRWDIWGGFQQYIRIFSQLATGETKSSNTGQVRELNGETFPYKTRLDQLGAFFRGKLAPVPGTVVDLLAGKTVVGEKFDPVTKAYELFTPMIAQDIADAWKDQGFKSVFTVGVPSSLGVGVTTYDSKKSGGSSGGGGATGHVTKEKPHKIHKTNR